MLEGSVVAFIFERDMNGWAIGWDSRLLAPVYAVRFNLVATFIMKRTLLANQKHKLMSDAKNDHTRELCALELHTTCKEKL